MAADHLFGRLANGPIAWERASLGLAVKKIFAEHFEVSLEFIEEWKVRDEIPPGFTGPIRNGLTTIGDGWRATRADIWLRKLFGAQPNANLLVSDIRYCNEAQYIRDRGGINILCWRPGWENSKPTRSEQELMPFVRRLMDRPDGPIHDRDIPFDLWLRNDGTLEDWFRKVDELVMPLVNDKFGMRVFQSLCMEVKCA